MIQTRRKRQRPWPRFVVVKSRIKKTHYALQDRWRELAAFDGPDGTRGQYERKEAAQKRARHLNKAFAEGRLCS